LKKVFSDVTESPHITVCICTYKRGALLKRLLQFLENQRSDGLFTYSIVVVDNDRLQSAQPLVSGYARSSSVPIVYCVEPRQNISAARNKAVQNAHGDFIAFIDDDEFPAKEWLLSLLLACEKYRADGVIGPVKRHFDQVPPHWVAKGNFYDRPTYPTGLVIDWSKGRTGNVLLKRSIMPADERPFRPEFRTGEDQDFFRRSIAEGHRFVWCDEAVAYETVSPIRWKRSFMLKRALLQGAAAASHPTFGVREITKSLLALVVYGAVLPFALLLPHHRFMALLVKWANHAGKLMAAIKIDPIKEPYVTQ